jgi:hypothetical protein
MVIGGAALASGGITGVNQTNQNHLVGFDIGPVEDDCLSSETFGVGAPEMINKWRVMGSLISKRKIIFNRTKYYWNNLFYGFSIPVFQIGSFLSLIIRVLAVR